MSLLSLCLLSFIALTSSLAASLTAKQEAQLLQKAKAWNVPQPTAQAELIKVWAHKSNSRPYYCLAFIEPDQPKTILAGLTVKPLMRGQEVLRIRNIDKLSLKNITSTPYFTVHTGYNFGLVTGIQLIRAGHLKVGRKLIEKSLREDAGHHRSPFNSPANESPVKMLARACLAQAMNSITTAKPDFPGINAQVNRILKDQPELKSKATEWLQKSLRVTLAHKPAAKGTVDALIDAYLLSGGTEGAMVFRQEALSPAEQALTLKGFEAIPALLKQRKSKRLTNHLMQGFNNFSSYPMTADLVINAYLQRFANDELGSNWLDRQKGYTSNDEAVLAWWKKASALGEKKYVKKHLLKTITEQGKKKTKLSAELLIIAEARYPDLLPAAYRRALKTELQSYDLAEAIARHSKISQNKKIDLLLKGVTTNASPHRNSALRQLQTLDPKLTAKHLVYLLRSSPNSTSTEYWLDQNAGLTHFVSQTNDLKVWQELHTLLSRVDLGMKMELIHNLKPPRSAPRAILFSFFEIYDRFKKDMSVRDETKSEKFSGPGAGFPHPRITMRDYIHTHWNSWLQLKIEEPKKGSTSKTWKKFRKKVAKSIAENRPS